MAIRKSTTSLLKKLGPGLITAALVFGPGSLTIASKLGAAFQYKLLWVVVISVLFMMVYTTMAARIGLASDKSLLQYIRSKYGKGTSWLLGIGIFLVTASFQAGISIGAGIAFAELFDTSPIPWIIFFSVCAIFMLFFSSFYKLFEKVMIGLVGFMLLSFIITMIITKPSLSTVFAGFIPSVPTGSEMLIIALTASTFSVIGAFFQAYLVREKGWKREDRRECINETVIGAGILGTITLTVLVCAGNVLYTQGIEVKSASDMGRTLEPLFGSFTSYMFTFGLFAASFTSLLGNSTLGGTMIADAFLIGEGLKDKKVRLLIMIIILIGSSIAIVFGTLPLQLIVFASSITILVVPAVALMLLLIANQKMMGTLSNKPIINIIAGIGLLVLVVLAISNMNMIFFK